jgi:hypothetical protein
MKNLSITQLKWIARIVAFTVCYIGMSLLVGGFDFTEWGWFARIGISIMFMWWMFVPINVKKANPNYTIKDLEDAFMAGVKWEINRLSNPTFPEWLEQHNLVKKK